MKRIHPLDDLEQRLILKKDAADRKRLGFNHWTDQRTIQDTEVHIRTLEEVISEIDKIKKGE